MNFLIQMNPEMLKNYPEPVQQLIEHRPYWATVSFFIAVFAGLVADIFLIWYVKFTKTKSWIK